MAGKETSIGIKLTADLRNYQQGLSKAKKQSRQFSKNVKSEMSGVTQSISALARGDISALPGFFRSATTAAGGFSKGLQGIKVALISTGIGAILVALGTAIAALTQYFKGTEEGQIVFKKVMNNISAYVQPVLQMFGKFGKAIMQLFSGDFSGAWNTAKEAVKGVGDQIEANTAQLDKLNTAEENYIQKRRKYSREIRREETELSELILKTRDEELKASERQKYILAAQKKRADITKKQLELAQMELDIETIKASFGDNTIEDKDKILELENQIYNIRKQGNDQMRELVNRQNEMANKVTREAEARRKSLEIQASITGPARTDASFNSSQITVPVQLAPVNMENTQSQIQEFALSGVQSMYTFRDAVSEVSGAFGMLGGAVGGTFGFMLNQFGQVLNLIPQLITQITALGTAEVATSQAVTSAKASEAIASGVATSQKAPPFVNLILLAATIAAIIKALATKPPKMAAGGLAYGRTLAEVGEYTGASSNPEVIAPLDKLRGIIGSNQSTTEVPYIADTKLSGDDIYITFKRAQARANRRT